MSDIQNTWPCVMIDIETLGTTDDALILEMGAVCFDRAGGLLGPEWGMMVDYLSQPGRRTDAATVAWWAVPERIGRLRALMHGNAEKPALWQGLLDLEHFIQAWLAPGGEVWAKGDFDLRILKHAFDEEKLEVPWRYSQARELRTVLKLAGVAPLKGQTVHQALADARAQVWQLWEAAARLQF